MRIDPFPMERTQSMYENQVEYNLSESGVLPLRLREVLEGAEDPGPFAELSLKYPPSNGSERLRDRIALLYGSATRDNVLVTAGGSKANYVTFWALLEKGDRVACMLPNYMQAWGLARAYGGFADPYRLVERRGNGAVRWALDVESLERAVTKKTRIILVTNPNNPTGGVLTDEEMDEIVRAARRVNAWIVADEIYRGAEVDGPMSPSFWGRYEKVSKAFGLPGLRIGWVLGPAKTIAKFWSYQDYTTLTPTAVSDHLASIVMEPVRRDSILARTRAILRKNLPRLEAWIRTHDDILSYVRPVAGAITLVRYHLPISSQALFEKLRLERSVLIMPGAHFGTGKYLRIGYGYDLDYTLRGLARVSLTLEELRESRAAGPSRSVVARRPLARERKTPPARARA